MITDVQERIGFELIERNILADPVAWERFRYEIPVVFIDGEKAFTLRVDEKAFEARLLARDGT